MVEARHPVVCNEHRLRDRARGWRSPYISILLNPVFVGDRPEVIFMAAGSKPFNLTTPLIRYLNLISDQAATFLEIASLRRERDGLGSANRNLKTLLKYVVGEASNGGNLQRMTEVLVESMGLNAGVLLRWDGGGRWKATVRCGLSEEEAQALAEDIVAWAAGVENPGFAWSQRSSLILGSEEGRSEGPGVLLLAVDPDSLGTAVGSDEVADLGDEGFEAEGFLPPYLLVLVLPEGFSPEEEMEVFRSFADCLADHLRRLSEEVW